VKEPKVKQPKFDFEKMKLAATSKDPETRKEMFKEYFERFEEFPSYLFDNKEKINDLLLQTIQDIKKDPETPEKMHKGIALLLERLPGVSETTL